MSDASQTDPFVTLKLGKKKIQRTRAIDNAGGHNVVFDETLSWFDKGLFENKLMVKVMDSDTLSDDTLGENLVNLNELEIPEEGEINKKWIDCMKQSGLISTETKKTGKVLLSFSRIACPRGAFEGLLHITVISIDGFKNKVDIVCKNLFLLVRAFVHACVLVFK